ncbi:MAG: LysM-like peptidoglycan-binding domain-containing protein, partial [bacterium]
MSARIRHLVAGAVTIGALVAAYVALNAPSASIAPSADPLASSATSIASSVTATATNAIQPSRQHDATRLDSTPTTSSPSAMIKLDSTPTHPASSPTATINHAVDSINAMHERTIDPINALETTPPPYPPEPADPSARRDWTTATVNRHDTLSRIFARHGLRVAEAYAVAGLEQAGALRRIRPGRRIAWAADERGRVTALRYAIDRFST